VTRSLLCGIATGICVVAGLAATLAHSYWEPVCTATNAVGRRIVIGTQLNDAGLRYRRDNPADSNDDILESTAGRGPEAAWTPGSIRSCTLKLAASAIVSTAAFPLAALLVLLAWLTRAPAAIRPKRGTVFLSYNHADKDAVARLHETLKRQGIPVLIDSEWMVPGERIEAFIERALQRAGTVVSVVSRRSLLSAWVALETVHALERNRWTGRQFIACYLDDDFTDPACRVRLTDAIDQRLQHIQDLLAEHAGRRLDTRDLDEEKTRLYDLRNHLGVILAALKDSLCLDLRDPTFDESAKRLIAAIRR
jgi:hypothetical protein